MALIAMALLRTINLAGQVPLLSAYDHLVVFDQGVFHDVEPRKPQAVYPSGDRLAYMSDAGDLKLYLNGKVITLERGESVDMRTSRHLLAWQSGPALRMPSGEGATTVCTRVGKFTVADSIVAYHDLMQDRIGVWWKGRSFPIADVLLGNEVPWKSGSNTLLLYDIERRQVLLFYRGQLTTLCQGADMSRSVPGGDVVAFMDEYDDTFRVFDRGNEFELEHFAPRNFQVGEGVVAFVNSTGAFRCYQDGELWDLMNFTPDDYWVRDSLVVFREGKHFKVFSKGVIETLDSRMPTQWHVSGGLIAWIDARGTLLAYWNGEKTRITQEAGIGEFNVYPGVVKYKSMSRDNKVWWNNKLYSHY